MQTKDEITKSLKEIKNILADELLAVWLGGNQNEFKKRADIIRVTLTEAEKQFKTQQRSFRDQFKSLSD